MAFPTGPSEGYQQKENMPYRTLAQQLNASMSETAKLINVANLLADKLFGPAPPDSVASSKSHIEPGIFGDLKHELELQELYSRTSVMRLEAIGRELESNI